MLNSQKLKISAIIKNITDVFKILLSLFLIFLVIMWFVEIFHIESHVPFFEQIKVFLIKFNSFFVTQDIREDGDSTVAYLSIVTIIFIVAFSFFKDIVNDMMSMYDRSHAEAIEEDNIRINEEIKKNYEFHLRHTMQFVIVARLKVFKDAYQALAFSDSDYLAKLEEGLAKMLNEIKSIIDVSIKCDKTSINDDLVFYIRTPEQLNRVLVFIKSVCKIEKYVKLGLEYYISVASHTVEEEPKAALDEALKILEVGSKNKILCRQIVAECLKTVTDNNFVAVANGDYADMPDSLYELVEKGSY